MSKLTCLANKAGEILLTAESNVEYWAAAGILYDENGEIVGSRIIFAADIEEDILIMSDDIEDE